MATIVKTVDIASPVQDVWAKVSDTGGISDLIGFLASSRLDGDKRVCRIDGGGELTEKIVSVDHGLKRVMYSITESPLNMEFHAASMQVVQNGAESRLIWTVDLAPASAETHMGPMLDAACEDMKTTLAA